MAKRMGKCAKAAITGVFPHCAGEAKHEYQSYT